MGNGVESGSFEPQNRVVIDRKGVPPADILRRFFVHRLESQLHPDGLYSIEPGEELHRFLWKAVRSCSDGEGGDVRVGNCLGKKAFQLFGRTVGVGVALEIGDIFPAGIFLFNPGFRPLNLLRHAFPGLFGESPAPAEAENTAPAPEGTVPVGAGEAAVQRQLIQFFPELFKKLGVKRAVHLSSSVLI